MDTLSLIVETTSSSSDLTNVNQIDQTQLKAFADKCSVWDYFDMSREEYLTKENSVKEKLILDYYNRMVKGMKFVICCLVFGLAPLHYCLEFVLESWYLEFGLLFHFQCYFHQLLKYHHLNLKYLNLSPHLCYNN